MFVSFRTVVLLTEKSLKTIVRNQSMRILVLVSALLVFGSFYVMFFLSRSHVIHYGSSKLYDSLQFEMLCKPNTQNSINGLQSSSKDISSDTTATMYDEESSQSSMQCEAFGEPEDNASGDLTPTDVLLNLIAQGSATPSDSQSTKQFVGLLTSILMNGIPLLGLDDFVSLSDFANKYIDDSVKSRMLSSAGYKAKFANFLNVRQSKLIVTPKSCWTEELVAYFQKKIRVFGELNVVVHESMAHAMNDCCEDVLAILEILAPKDNPNCQDFTIPTEVGTETDNNGKHKQRNDTSSDVGAVSLNITGTSAFLEGIHGTTVSDNGVRSAAESSDHRRYSNSSHNDRIGTRNSTSNGATQDGLFQSPGSINNELPLSTEFVPTEEEQELGLESSRRQLYSYKKLMESNEMLIPTVTIRMHPGSVPDTRNFENSPFMNYLTRQQSGQLLYFTSGFLSLQMEIQNFLGAWKLGGPIIDAEVFSGGVLDESLLLPGYAAQRLAEALLKAEDEEAVYQALSDATVADRGGQRPQLYFPLFHRAFPTRKNSQVPCSIYNTSHLRALRLFVKKMFSRIMLFVIKF